MYEDNNILEYISRRVNTDYDISGQYFHVLKSLNKRYKLAEFFQYAVNANKICPGKSVSDWFWEFCRNLDLLRDSSEYVNQRVKLYCDGKITPFPLKFHRNVKTRSERGAFLLYLEEYSGMDMSNATIDVVDDTMVS